MPDIDKLHEVVGHLLVLAAVGLALIVAVDILWPKVKKPKWPPK